MNKLQSVGAVNTITSKRVPRQRTGCGNGAGLLRDEVLLRSTRKIYLG
jgi:hypothetical protein